MAEKQEFVSVPRRRSSQRWRNARAFYSENLRYRPHTSSADGNGNPNLTRTFGPGNRCRVTVETGRENTGGHRRGREQVEPRLLPAQQLRRRRSSPDRYDVAEVVLPESSGDEGSQPSPSVPSSDSEELAGDVDFDLPTPPAATRVSETIDFPLTEVTPADSDVARSRPRFSGPLVDTKITRSRWLGTTYDRGELSAEITLDSLTPGTSEKASAPLIRWVHLERNMMNFEEFMSAAESVLPPRENVHRAVTRLLRDRQHKFEQQRQNGRDMEPNFSSDTFYAGQGQAEKETASVKFMAFPYHCLARYDSTQIRALAPGSPLHPLRSMLQAHFIATTDKRELAQAVTYMPRVQTGECLHVSQLWCLIVNGDTIVTCSRLSLDVICDDYIRQNTASPSHSGPHVSVSTEDGRIWRIPISQETSWPAFLSTFEDVFAVTGDQSELPVLAGPKGIVSGLTWPHVVETAGSSAPALTLKVDSAPPMLDKSYRSANRSRYQTTRRSATYRGQEKTAGKPDGSKLEDGLLKKITEKKGLRMFMQQGNTSTMQAQADRLHSVLLENNRSQERTAYVDCPSANVADVDSWLANNEVGGGDSSSYQGINRHKRKYALLARFFFITFWPADFQHPMIDKFWGAVLQTLTRQSKFFNDVNGERGLDYRVSTELSSLIHEQIFVPLAKFSMQFLNYEENLMPLPDNFVKCWLHFLTGVVLVAQTPLSKNVLADNAPIAMHLDATSNGLIEGSRTIAARLRFASLDDVEVCPATSLVTLTLGVLLKDMTDGRVDVETTYTRYFQMLDFQIKSNPNQRSHQEKLRFYLQEIEAVLATLNSQASVLDLYIECIEAQNKAGNNTDSLHLMLLGESRQSDLLDRCRAAIASKITTITGLQGRAEDLGEWHREQLETNKDRQESAILVFTVVTIIFLPLSFVSSVFGMNTLDIRNMRLTQWSYWAAALPITFVVVVGSMWWAGFLEGFGESIYTAFSRRKTAWDGYERLEDSGAEQPPRNRRGRRRRSQYITEKSSNRKGGFYPPPPKRRDLSDISA